MSAPAGQHDAGGVLERFLEQVIVDDYADLPATSTAAPRGHWPALIVMAVIGVLLTAAVISTNAAGDQRQSTRDALIARVTTLTADVTVQQTAVDDAASRVDALRASVLAAGDVDTTQLESVAVQAAATPVSGPGVVLTVDDAPGAAAGSLNRVLDRDLQDIVNALWRDGASAVSVNGQRLTSTTAIRGAGDAILVNYQPLTRPYVISAAGAGGRAMSVAGVTVLLDALRTDYGLVAEVAAGDVALPVGEVRTPRFAHVDEGAPAP